MSHKNQASPVSRRVLFPALVLARHVHFRYRVALQAPFPLLCAAIP